MNIGGDYKSPFELYGDGFIDDLKNEKKLRKTKLYDYQIDALLAMHTYFKSNGNGISKRRFLIVAPTGSGKSGIISLAPFVLKSKKVLVLTPSLDITTQLYKTFGYEDSKDLNFYQKVGITIDQKLVQPKVIGSSKEFLEPLPHIVINNAQKFGGKSLTSLFTFDDDEERLENVKAALAKFSTIIVDEAHHFPAKTWREIVNQFDGKEVVFLTATPFYYHKGVKQYLYDVYQMEHHEIPRNQVDGITIRLSDFDSLDTDKHLQLEGILKVLDEHDTLEPKIKHKSLVYVSTQLEAYSLSEFWNQQTPNPVTTFLTSQKNTSSNLLKFETDPDIRILIICGKLIEGYDNPNVSVCAILCNLESGIRFNQFVGRCLRMSPKELVKDKVKDQVKGMILSAPKYNQRKMYDTYKDEGISVCNEESEETDEEEFDEYDENEIQRICNMHKLWTNEFKNEFNETNGYP